MSNRRSTVSDSVEEIRFHCDIDGRFEQVSLEWVQWIGLGIEDVSGKSWIAFVAAERRAEAEEAWRRGVADKSTIEIETHFCGRYGEDVRAEVRFLPCLDTLGELFGFAARLRPSPRERSADRTGEAVVSGLSALGWNVVVASVDGAVLGQEPTEPGDTLAVERLFPEVEPWQATWAELVQSESPTVALSSGEDEIFVAAAYDADGQVAQALVTRSPATPAEQRHYYSSLEATGLLCKRFAHDLNNSLALVAGYADLLAGAVALELADDAEQLQQRIRGTTALGDSLHRFLEPGEPRSHAFSLERLLGRLLPLLRAAVGQRTVVEAEIDPVLPEVEADSHRLELLLLNLAIECRKVERSGRLSLRASERGRGVALVFDYEPAEPNDVDLSLATALSRAAGVRCTVSANSVDLELVARARPAYVDPAYMEPAPVDEGGSVHEGAATARREGVRVLVAEDEKVTRDLISRRLRSAGYAVTVAADGEQALDLYEALENEVDIVVTDILMPNKDGVSLARELKERSPDLKMLMISGQKSAADRLLDREVLLVGTPVMQKPFSSETLVSEIHELLTRPPSESPTA